MRGPPGHVRFGSKDETSAAQVTNRRSRPLRHIGAPAAQMGDLRRISQRFGREADIRAGDIEMSRWLRRNR